MGHLATIADAAAVAGSTSRDVAMVLAADPRVPSDLRHRIVDAIGTTGYRPLAAIQARLGRPLRFAIVFKTYQNDDPEANRFYTPIASAIAIACAERGAAIRQAMMIVDDQFELLEVPSALTDGDYDGACFIGTRLHAGALEEMHAICPIVLVDGYADGDSADSVVIDNFAGATMAVEQLVAAGHRDIGLIGTEPICYRSVQDRRMGYAEALESRGLAPHFIDASYILPEAVAVIGVDYVQRHPAVTAIFGVTDLVTIAFMHQARDAGLRIPADLSLVGFDDIDLASLVMPALTTVAVDKRLMGRAAFALLTHRLELPAAAPVEAVVVPRLIERESVVAPLSR
ncbi:MAG TPA: LacI family DNA-binding transcriptional regulator [Candidatus Limnocylindrales bacterium]